MITMKKPFAVLCLLLLFSGCVCQRWTFGASKELLLVKAANQGERVDRTELLDAINELGDDKVEEAAEPLIVLLENTGDFAVGNACIDALSNLKHPKAMDAIIEFVERKPPVIRRQAILAARKIANKAAAEWLLVMAYGHEDATVRREAGQALEELEKKLGLETKE